MYCIFESVVAENISGHSVPKCCGHGLTHGAALRVIAESGCY